MKGILAVPMEMESTPLIRLQGHPNLEMEPSTGCPVGVGQLSDDATGCLDKDSGCDRKAIRCRICQKDFGLEEDLSVHTMSHLESRKCCLCQKVLGNRSKLLTHHRY